ncbi:uncharacterized protein [Littorina saxatilis]
MGLEKPVDTDVIASGNPVGLTGHHPSAITDNASLDKLSDDFATFAGVSRLRGELARTSPDNMSLMKAPGSLSLTKPLPLTQPLHHAMLTKFTDTTNASYPNSLTLPQPSHGTMLTNITHTTNATNATNPRLFTLTQPSEDTALTTLGSNARRSGRHRRSAAVGGVRLRNTSLNLVDPLADSPFRVNALVISHPKHALIRERGNGNRMLMFRDGVVTMSTVSYKHRCQAVFRIQHFWDKNTGHVLSTMFHVESQSFLAVSPDTHDVIMVHKAAQHWGHQPSPPTVTLHSPSTDLERPPFSANSTDLRVNGSSALTTVSSSGLSVDSSTIDRRPISSNLSFDSPGSFDGPLTEFSGAEDSVDWPPHPTCLFVIINQSHVCIKPAIGYPHENLSFRHSDGRVVTVRDHTPWVFSFMSVRDTCNFLSSHEGLMRLRTAAYVIIFVQRLTD